MRIGFKYCGGCNPRYDRVQIISQMKERYPDFEIISVNESSDFDAIVVVCGCRSQCADHTDYIGRRGKVILSDAADYSKLCDLLDNIRNKGVE